VSLAKRLYYAAKSTAAMSYQLGRATGRPSQAIRFAALHLARDNTPSTLDWRGMSLQARRIDWAALQEVLIENEYGALAPYITSKPSPVVLDLGANIGTFALFVASLAREAKLHSYEPSTATYAILSANAAANPSLAWTTTRAAAWHEDGTISFSNASASTAGRVEATGDERVPALSLASIVKHCGGAIDIAKIDIEGAEEALLAGRNAELAAIETLVVEMHPDRCDCARVEATLREVYGPLYVIPGRRSSKPLLLMTRSTRKPALPLHEGSTDQKRRHTDR
jgi:FkbM family methyltransferase